LSRAIVTLYPRGLLGGLLPTFSEEFQDVRREIGRLSSCKYRLQLLCQLLRRRLAKDSDVPDLPKQKTIR
jgi:hypothetical protein